MIGKIREERLLKDTIWSDDEIERLQGACKTFGKINLAIIVTAVGTRSKGQVISQLENMIEEPTSNGENAENTNGPAVMSDAGNMNNNKHHFEGRPRIDHVHEKRTGVWQDDEILRLRKAIYLHGKDSWEALAIAVGTRSKAQIKNLCVNAANGKSNYYNYNLFDYTNEEDDTPTPCFKNRVGYLQDDEILRLRKAIYLHGKDNLDALEIAVGTRSKAQIKNLFVNIANGKSHYKLFDYKEDLQKQSSASKVLDVDAKKVCLSEGKSHVDKASKDGMKRVDDGMGTHGRTNVDASESLMDNTSRKDGRPQINHVHDQSDLSSMNDIVNETSSDENSSPRIITQETLEHCKDIDSSENEARQKQLLLAMQQYGARITGLKKSLPDLSDQEILNMIDQIRKERQIKDTIWSDDEIERLQDGVVLFGGIRKVTRIVAAVGTRSEQQIISQWEKMIGETTSNGENAENTHGPALMNAAEKMNNSVHQYDKKEGRPRTNQVHDQSDASGDNDDVSEKEIESSRTNSFKSRDNDTGAIITILRRTEDKSSTVKYNIGGKLYEVSRTLLESFPETILFSISSERWTTGCTNDIFIDRDSERFQYILDYMRDNEVHLPCSVSKEALLNDFKFYGFKMSANAIKTTFVHPTDVADQLTLWEKQHSDEIDQLEKLSRHVALEKKYTDLCYRLLEHYLQTRLRYVHLAKSDFEKYGSFITHTGLEECASSTTPHPTYLQNRMLQKCAQKFQISYINACSHKDHYSVSFGMMEKAEIEDKKERTIGSKEKVYLYFDEDSSSSKKQKKTDDNEV